MRSRQNWFKREELWSDRNDKTFIQLFEALTCIFHVKYLTEILNHSVHVFQQFYTARYEKLKFWGKSLNWNYNYVIGPAMITQSVWSLKFVVTHITLIINLWWFVSGIICHWHIIVAPRIIESANLIWGWYIVRVTFWKSHLWCSESRIN